MKTNLQATRLRRQGYLWRWSKKVLKGLTAFIVGLLLIGMIYQFAATKIDEGNYQPPGKMVDVGGHHLHLYCIGGGEATVIMDAGLGGGSLDWSAVQPEASKFARVCTYDRAGIGWSERGIAPRTSQQIVTELHTLLANAGIQPPFVLVGHSLAGINVQLYASRYPSEVVGMILVDSSHENQLSHKEFQIPSFVPLLTKILAPFGVARLINHAASPNPNLPINIDIERNALYSHTGNMYAVADEMSFIRENMELLRSAPMKFGDKPLIVIARGKKEDPSEEADRTEQAWRVFQTDLASRSANGKLIITERSGHNIQFDQPEIVIEAIRQIVEVDG